jgi:hypothetical protein
MTAVRGLGTLLALFLFCGAGFAQTANIVEILGFAQVNPAAPASHVESTQDLLARMSLQQKQQFDDAAKASSAQRYADALAIYKQLLTELPGDAVLSKFASENAINAGNPSFALNTLRPIAQADPDDWQAAALLTRACAEVGDVTCRDAGIAHMLDLHSRGVTPPRMQQYVVERVKTGENILQISTSLVPWGNYKVYAVGKVSDPQGKLVLQATIESADFDQPGFAKENPEEAAKGTRKFSLDAYKETGLNSGGQRTQSHFTYKFFVGQPSYETVRDEFIKIATGKSTPISSRTGLIVP